MSSLTVTVTDSAGGVSGVMTFAISDGDVIATATTDSSGEAILTGLGGGYHTIVAETDTRAETAPFTEASDS